MDDPRSNVVAGPLVPARRPLGSWALVLTGLTVGPVFGWLTVQLVGRVWSACSDIAGGPAFGLIVVDLPMTILAVWIAFSGGAFFLRRRGTLSRILVALLLAASTSFAILTLLAPDGAAYRSGADLTTYPECGPHGMPTWWPSWLPASA